MPVLYIFQMCTIGTTAAKVTLFYTISYKKPSFCHFFYKKVERKQSFWG